MPFHCCGYVITDGIIPGSQKYGIVIAESNVLGGVRDICFKRKAGAFRQHNLMAQKRCKGAVLRIAGRSRRAAWPGFANRTLRTCFTLRALWSRNALRTRLPALAGTALLSGGSSWALWSGFASWSGRTRSPAAVQAALRHGITAVVRMAWRHRVAAIVRMAWRHRVAAIVRMV